MPGVKIRQVKIKSFTAIDTLKALILDKKARLTPQIQKFEESNMLSVVLFPDID